MRKVNRCGLVYNRQQHGNAHQVAMESLADAVQARQKRITAFASLVDRRPLIPCIICPVELQWRIIQCILYLRDEIIEGRCRAAERKAPHATGLNKDEPVVIAVASISP